MSSPLTMFLAHSFAPQKVNSAGEVDQAVTVMEDAGWTMTTSERTIPTVTEAYSVKPTIEVQIVTAWLR